MTVDEAKELDIVDYLQKRGYQPQKISGHQFWFFSPFREEGQPSFKVNRKINRWFDFGEGVGGNLVDLGIRMQQCTVSEFLRFIDFGGLASKQKTTFHDNETSLQIISSSQIRSIGLIKYLKQRKILLSVAEKYLVEVRYKIRDMNYFALGFKNDFGGYELRNAAFKGSSSPKSSTFMNNNARSLCVFEGFFDFLSYCSINDKKQNPDFNFLILNSVSFFEKSLSVMQAHQRVDLFLDNDTAGTRCVVRALTLDKNKFIDKRALYEKYQDLNEWLVNYDVGKKLGFRSGL